MSEYTSTFGVTRIIGLGEGVDKRNGTSALGDAGSIHELIVPLSKDAPSFNKDANNDGTFDSFGRGAAYVPAGAFIDTVDLAIKSATSVTVLNVGLYQKDGTVIDADGLAAEENVSAGLIAGDGALVGTKLAYNGYIVAAVTGTAVDGEIVVRYIL